MLADTHFDVFARHVHHIHGRTTSLHLPVLRKTLQIEIRFKEASYTSAPVRRPRENTHVCLWKGIQVEKVVRKASKDVQSFDEHVLRVYYF